MIIGSLDPWTVWTLDEYSYIDRCTRVTHRWRNLLVTRSTFISDLSCDMLYECNITMNERTSGLVSGARGDRSH